MDDDCVIVRWNGCDADDDDERTCEEEILTYTKITQRCKYIRKKCFCISICGRILKYFPRYV